MLPFGFISRRNICKGREDHFLLALVFAGLQMCHGKAGTMHGSVQTLENMESCIA